MQKLHLATFLLLVIGGLNWLLVGLFSFNLVEAIFGASSALTSLIYILVGLSAIYEVVTHKANCKACEVMMKPAAPAMGGVMPPR
jgi:hypothetical protein